MHLSRLDVNINAYHCHHFIFFINITSINSRKFHCFSREMFRQCLTFDSVYIDSW